MLLAKFDFLKYHIRPIFAVEPDAGSGEDVSAGAGVADAPVTTEDAPQDLDAIILKALEGRGDDGELVAPVDPDQAATPRKRGPDGRFANPAEDAPGDAGSADAATTTDPATTEQPALTAQSLPAPEAWTAEHKASFAKLPVDGQKLILDRHAEMQADYTRKTQEIAEFRKSTEPLLKAVEPFSEYLRQIGIAPASALGTLLGTERILRTGTPEEKALTFARLHLDYNVNPADVYNLIQQGRVTKPAPLNPQHQQQIQQQDQRLAAIEQRDQERDRAEQSRQATTEIESFRNAKTADGKPKYPHYDAVIGSMSDWLGSEPKELAGKSLPQMLDAAYTRFGGPIEAEIKRQIGERQKAATEANSAAVAKARGAAPVRSNGSTPKGSTTSRDLDSIITASMAKAGM